MARPRKKYPKASFVRRLLKNGTPWKIIEWRTGVSRPTICRRVLNRYPEILNASDDCDETPSEGELSPNAA